MNNEIKEFSIKALLSDNVNYIIPMYQRNYAWGEGEINQLVQDILDYQKTKNEQYYIGTLVVHQRENNVLEIIDGQQRFTTLSLLAIYLKNLLSESGKNLQQQLNMDWYKKVNITFESRIKSKNTLDALNNRKQPHQLKNDNYSDGIVKGYELIQKALENKELNIDKVNFVQYLFENVKILSIFVPQNTDLNHYFETMNSRGEQLEMHEILKAKMLSVFKNDDDTDTKVETDKNNHFNALNKVWDACANMDSYVQYGFSLEDRHKIFGNNWHEFKIDSFDDLMSIESKKSDKALKISEIIANEFKSGANDKSRKKDESQVRFNSVINFPNFLLQVIRVYTKKDISLDDKNLIKQFEEHVLNADNPKETVKKFTFALLKCKFLLDNYIIKREYEQNKDSWSLKKLKYYEKSSANYINSFNEEYGEKEINQKILMLLSAFHVSTPTLTYKHWLSAALNYLFNEKNIDAKQYLDYLTKIAKRFVFDNYLAKEAGETYYDMIFNKENEYAPMPLTKNIDLNKLNYGNIKNNFIFNYLDYLLWLKNKDNIDDKGKIAKNFNFTFRSSVEHFYPQHPIDGNPKKAGDELHDFGNLCLISHSKNSRLSNFQPNAKSEHFTNEINNKSIDSLKLYEMIKLLKNEEVWDKKQIDHHGNEMLNVLFESPNAKEQLIELQNN